MTDDLDRARMTEFPYHEASPGRRRLHLSFTRLLWLALFVIVVAAIATNLHEVKQIIDEFRTARPPFVIATAVVEVLFVLNLTFFYVTTFWATDLRASPWRFVFITQASYFVNLVSKTAGIGGIAFYLREARRTEQPVARVSAAYMAAYILGYAAFFVVLTAALITLYLQGSLTRAEVIASLIIAGIIVAVGAVPVAAISSRRMLQRVYLLAVRPLNEAARLLHRPPPMNVETVQASADELYDAITFVRRRPAGYVIPFVHALGVEVFAAALLYLMAHAVHANISVPQALSAYAISLLFSLVAITPSGIGFVEVSLSLLLVSFGIEKNTAIAAAIGYRAFEFWLPVLLGAASLPVLQQIQRIPEKR
jgi:uncharacterized protein (TIRG00374 family)